MISKKQCEYNISMYNLVRLEVHALINKLNKIIDEDSVIYPCDGPDHALYALDDAYEALVRVVDGFKADLERNGEEDWLSEE